MTRDLVQLRAKLALITKGNFDDRFTAPLRLSRRSLQCAFYSGPKFIESPTPYWVAKNADRRVCGHRLDHAGNRGGFERLDRPQDRIERFFRMKFLEHTDEQR